MTADFNKCLKLTKWPILLRMGASYSELTSNISTKTCSHQLTVQFSRYIYEKQLHTIQNKNNTSYAIATPGSSRLIFWPRFSVWLFVELLLFAGGFWDGLLQLKGVEAVEATGAGLVLHYRLCSASLTVRRRIINSQLCLL